MKKTLKLLFSDEYLVVIDKPAGMLSIPDRYDPSASAANLELEPEFGSLFVVHRIDKDTSGLLVFARDALTHRGLSAQFAGREVYKAYLALVRGSPDGQTWDCALPLLVDADRFHRTVIDAKRGKQAVSRFSLLERYRDYSLVRVEPETGRTHQIRVHCAATGLPIVADPLYGDGKPLLLSQIKRGWRGDPYEERPLIERTALHAERIRFRHPSSGEEVTFELPPPKDMAAAISQLRKAAGAASKDEDAGQP